MQVLVGACSSAANIQYMAQNLYACAVRTRHFQACRGYGYPWIYPCVNIRLKPFCGHIHGYYAGASAN